MSNDNNPTVTISKADLDSLVANLIEARACIEVATSAASRNNPSSLVSAESMEQYMKRLISYTWKQAIEFANMHVEDEVCKEITVGAHIDERVYDSLDISIRGEVEAEVNLGDHLDIEIPEKYDGVEQTHNEILQGFLEQEEKREDEGRVAAKAAALAETVDLAEIPTADKIYRIADPHNKLAGVKVVGSIDLSKNNA